MKRIIQISALILLYLLTTAKSCENREGADDANDAARVATARDSIRLAFESDMPSGTSLRAFEGAARIRLADFSDYLAIIQDTTVAEVFRKKANEMIRSLFISGNSVFRFPKPDRLGIGEVTVNQILAPGREFTPVFGKILADSIRVQQALHKAGDSIFKGILSYSCLPTGDVPAKNREQVTGDVTVGFLLIRHEKRFGTETLMIWDIFLGDME
jgi:hypothetical protein